MATLVRWEPLRELATLQTEMSRLMNGLFEGNGRTSQSWVPAVDVWETENELVYAFDDGPESIRAALAVHRGGERRRDGCEVEDIGVLRNPVLRR